MRLFLLWVSYLHAIGYSPGEALWINMDETPVPYSFGGRKGTRVKRKRFWRPSTRTLVGQSAALRLARGQATLVASICTNPAIQQSLPQIFMPNTRGMKKKWAAVGEAGLMPQNIQVQFGTTGWQTVETMFKYIARMKKALTKAKVKKVVLVMDCHTSHLSYRTLSRIAKQRWKVLLVPGKMTWLLQPLDAYMFAELKQHLHDQNVRERLEDDGGEQSFYNWAQTCFRVVSNLFAEKDTYSMFNKCGCCLPSAHISRRVMRYVDHSKMPNFRAMTEDEFSLYTGTKKKTAVHKLLFRSHVPASMVDRCIAINRPVLRLSSKKSHSELS